MIEVNLKIRRRATGGWKCHRERRWRGLQTGAAYSDEMRFSATIRAGSRRIVRSQPPIAAEGRRDSAVTGCIPGEGSPAAFGQPSRIGVELPFAAGASRSAPT
jgi:hypothetical protein